MITLHTGINRIICRIYKIIRQAFYHCVCMSWNFYFAYVDEAYALLSPDLLKTDGKSPEGFDLAQLRQDLQEVTA